MQKKRRKEREMERGLNSLKHKDADFSYGTDNLCHFWPSHTVTDSFSISQK